MARAMARNGTDGRQFIELAIRYKGDKCFVWPYARDRYGYAMTGSYDGRSQTVAPIVCEVVHGPKPDPGMDCAHSENCISRACINPRHLRWATRKENAQDRKAFGFHNRGGRNGNAKLNELQVMQIRSAKRGEMADLARKFGVSLAAVYEAHRRGSWKHIQ